MKFNVHQFDNFNQKFGKNLRLFTHHLTQNSLGLNYPQFILFYELKQILFSKQSNLLFYWLKLTEYIARVKSTPFEVGNALFGGNSYFLE